MLIGKSVVGILNLGFSAFRSLCWEQQGWAGGGAGLLPDDLLRVKFEYLRLPQEPHLSLRSERGPCQSGDQEILKNWQRPRAQREYGREIVDPIVSEQP